MKKLSNCKVKQLSKPWITNGIKVAIKIKNKLCASGDEVRYKHYRNKICTLTCLSERRYYDTVWENNMVNMKNPGKESMNFYINGKKLKSHICTMVRAETERYDIVRFGG